jgi:hypothetical protein
MNYPGVRNLELGITCAKTTFIGTESCPITVNPTTGIGTAECKEAETLANSQGKALEYQLILTSPENPLLPPRTSYRYLLGGAISSTQPPGGTSALIRMKPPATLGSAFTYFTVQRNKDGGEFSDIPEVPKSNAVTQQTYTDSNVIKGSTYCYLLTSHFQNGSTNAPATTCLQITTPVVITPGQ